MSAVAHHARSLLLASVASSTLAHAAAAHTVRVFAVNPRVELRYADSYADYHDKMAALLDATHPRRAELVQSQAGDVASHLRPSDPLAPTDVLVVFPEDVGLIAGLIGSRGAAARAVTAIGGSTTAFISLNLAYTSQIRYYAQRYPGLPGLRSLFLAATDTYYRAFYETFRGLAQTHAVHIAASVNVAPAHRIDDPLLVSQLRDPDEPSRAYAYEALSPNPVNTLFLFAPDGEVLVLDQSGNTVRSPSQTDGVLRGSLAKAYLTEVEQDPLGLAYGAVRDLGVLDTPVGRIGSVISKDAWMIDVNDRYDAERAQLVLQAEAFDTWGFLVDPWAPDGFKDGGFAQVQRNPSFRFNVTPCLVGNLFEVTFDGQSAIIGKRRKGTAPSLSLDSAWIGQNPDSGFIAIAPWVRDDPALQTPSLTLTQRRTQLVAAGSSLLPLSGVACADPNGPGVCENGYSESIIFADLDLPDGNVPTARTPSAPVATAFDPSQAIAAPINGDQRHPSIAAHADKVYTAFQESRAGVENVYLAVSHDGGQSFSVKRVSDNAAGAVVEIRPSLALSRDGTQVLVAWQEFCIGHDDSCGRIKLAHFDANGAKLGSDIRVDHGADDAGKWNPAVAVSPHGQPMVAWVDERDHGPGDIPFEHIYFARSVGRTRAMGPSVRVDSGPPVLASKSLDNKWAPTVVASNSWIHVLWADFRNYNWDIYSARSDNGTRFRPNVRVDDAVGLERIHDHPVPAIDGSGRLHVVWADRRLQEPVTAIRHARSDNRGRSFGTSARVDATGRQFDPDRDTPNNQWHPVLAASGSDLFVAWQDNRLGDDDIFFARSRDHGETFDAAERVDDSGDDPSDQYRPAIAVDAAASGGRTLYVAWEDERFGSAQITITRRRID